MLNAVLCGTSSWACKQFNDPSMVVQCKERARHLYATVLSASRSEMSLNVLCLNLSASAISVSLRELRTRD